MLRRIHLGEGVFINTDDIIGLFDIEKVSANTDTREFLRHLGKNAVTITYDMPKSFLVTREKTYISKLAPAVIKGKIAPTGH
jgi:hypothetical protein